MEWQAPFTPQNNTMGHVPHRISGKGRAKTADFVCVSWARIQSLSWARYFVALRAGRGRRGNPPFRDGKAIKWRGGHRFYKVADTVYGGNSTVHESHRMIAERTTAEAQCRERRVGGPFGYQRGRSREQAHG
jgi:hypothetical protein